MDMAEYGLDRGLDSGAPTGGMTLDEAILSLRANPSFVDLVEDAYLGRDVAASADRSLRSAEFTEVQRLLGPMLHHAVVADIGAGTGIASYALHKSGASRVFAVEPDASDEVGRGAIERLREDTSAPIEILDGARHRLSVMFVRRIRKTLVENGGAQDGLSLRREAVLGR